MVYADFDNDGMLNYVEYSKAIARSDANMADKKSIDEQLIT